MSLLDTLSATAGKVMEPAAPPPAVDTAEDLLLESLLEGFCHDWQERDFDTRNLLWTAVMLSDLKEDTQPYDVDVMAAATLVSIKRHSEVRFWHIGHGLDELVACIA
jgi:hypothetical protein